MSYEITTNDNNTLKVCYTLGEAFSFVDDYCKINKAKYGLGNIYHCLDNKVGIDIYNDRNHCKQLYISYID